MVAGDGAQADVRPADADRRGRHRHSGRSAGQAERAACAPNAVSDLGLRPGGQAQVLTAGSMNLAVSRFAARRGNAPEGQARSGAARPGLAPGGTA
jgi:hypothetical protein